MVGRRNGRREGRHGRRRVGREKEAPTCLSHPKVAAGTRHKKGQGVLQGVKGKGKGSHVCGQV